MQFYYTNVTENELILLVTIFLLFSVNILKPRPFKFLLLHRRTSIRRSIIFNSCNQLQNQKPNEYLVNTYLNLHVHWPFFSDAANRKNNFAIGEIFEKEWGQRKKGIMHTNCSLPESNKMFCVLEERERGWNLTEEFDFLKVHMR